MDLFGNLFDTQLLTRIFGDAVSKEFSQTLAIFVAAAYVHGRQVSGAIKREVGLLTEVLRADLDAQKDLVGRVNLRVDKIELQLQNRGQ